MTSTRHAISAVGDESATIAAAAADPSSTLRVFTNWDRASPPQRVSDGVSDGVADSALAIDLPEASRGQFHVAAAELADFPEGRLDESRQPLDLSGL